MSLWSIRSKEKGEVMFKGIFSTICVMIFTISCYAGDGCVVQGNAGRVVVDCTGTAHNQKPINITDLTSNPNVNNVPEVCDAMAKLGFKSVFSIPCINETVVAENRVIDGFTYKAIVYHQKNGGPNFIPKIAISALYNADGTPATKLDYLKLVLAGKLDYPAYAGVWLPKKSYPPALEYTWRKGTKIETVAVLEDGRSINLIRPANATPMFSVERHWVATVNDVTSKLIVTPRHTTTKDRIRGNNRKKWEVPTEQSLRRDGYLNDNEMLLRVIAVEEVQMSESINTVDTEFETTQVFVTQERKVPQMSMIVYPYTE